jgi:hypothetical protein
VSRRGGRPHTQLLRRRSSRPRDLRARRGRTRVPPQDAALAAGGTADVWAGGMAKHVAIWIDHKEARLFSILPEKIDEETVKAPLHNIHHKHPRSAASDRAHPDDLRHFFEQIVRALEGVEEILVVGPSTAKLELHRYLHQHAHALEAKIVGIETVDHPTDGQLVAYARTYFDKIDRMR